MIGPQSRLGVNQSRVPDLLHPRRNSNVTGDHPQPFRRKIVVVEKGKKTTGRLICAETLIKIRIWKGNV